jgi:hypothetical protein
MNVRFGSPLIRKPPCRFRANSGRLDAVGGRSDTHLILNLLGHGPSWKQARKDTGNVVRAVHKAISSISGRPGGGGSGMSGDNNIHEDNDSHTLARVLTEPMIPPPNIGPTISPTLSSMALRWVKRRPIRRRSARWEKGRYPSAPECTDITVASPQDGGKRSRNDRGRKSKRYRQFRQDQGASRCRNRRDQGRIGPLVGSNPRYSQRVDHERSS